jgi:Rieske Fe-S protein
MASNNKQDKTPDCTTAISRRTVLKIAAGAPLLFTFGLLTSPLARFLKPTMKPGGFFQPADIPGGDPIVEFNMSDFPVDWSYIPFNFRLKYVVFNPEQELIHRIPGVAVRIADQIVAFSRICPKRGCLLEYKTEMCCGCEGNCHCHLRASGPVLICPKDYIMFDLADGGRVMCGPAPRPQRQFRVKRQGDLITIDFEIDAIA